MCFHVNKNPAEAGFLKCSYFLSQIALNANVISKILQIFPECGKDEDRKCDHNEPE